MFTSQNSPTGKKLVTSTLTLWQHPTNTHTINKQINERFLDLQTFMYVHLCVCLFVCGHILCVSVCTCSLCVHMCTCVCVCVYESVCVCVCVYESVCASVSLCILLGCRCPWKQGEQLMGVLRTEPWFSERVGKGSWFLNHLSRLCDNFTYEGSEGRRARR
jgi:hypothetical protein